MVKGTKMKFKKGEAVKIQIQGKWYVGVVNHVSIRFVRVKTGETDKNRWIWTTHEELTLLDSMKEDLNE